MNTLRQISSILPNSLQPNNIPASTPMSINNPTLNTDQTTDFAVIAGVNNVSQSSRHVREPLRIPLLRSPMKGIIKNQPISVDDLYHATEDAFDLIASKIESDPERKDELEVLYAHYIEASTLTSHHFFADDNGQRAKTLVELLQIDQKTLLSEVNLNRVTSLLSESRHIARLITAMLRRVDQAEIFFENNDAFNILSTGPDNKTTLIAAIQTLCKRLQGMLDEHTEPWELDISHIGIDPLIVEDPLSIDDNPVLQIDPQTRWAHRRIIAWSRGTEARTPLQLSQQVTERLIFEIGQAIEHISASALPNRESLLLAYKNLYDWLIHKKDFYKKQNGEDVLAYNLIDGEFFEPFADLIESLNTIKFHDPAFFVEMLGVNPYSAGGVSPYWGNFLQKALANTRQRLKNACLDAMATRELFDRALTLDCVALPIRIDYFDTLVAGAREDIESEKKSKQIVASAFWMVAISFIASKGLVAHEFKKMRRLNPEAAAADVMRMLGSYGLYRIQETLDTLANAPVAVLQRPAIIIKLAKIFHGIEPHNIESFQQQCKRPFGPPFYRLLDQMPTITIQNGQVVYSPFLKIVEGYARKSPSLDSFLERAFQNRLVVWQEIADKSFWASDPVQLFSDLTQGQAVKLNSRSHLNNLSTDEKMLFLAHYLAEHPKITIKKALDFLGLRWTINPATLIQAMLVTSNPFRVLERHLEPLLSQIPNIDERDKIFVGIVNHVRAIGIEHPSYRLPFMDVLINKKVLKKLSSWVHQDFTKRIFSQLFSECIADDLGAFQSIVLHINDRATKMIQKISTAKKAKKDKARISDDNADKPIERDGFIYSDGDGFSSLDSDWSVG